MKSPIVKTTTLLLLLAAGVVLTGCVTDQYNNGRRYQQTAYSNRCESCGVVQDVQQVYVQGGGGGNGGTLGAVIGAVAGGVLGSTIGKGDGRTAATVVGAVGGGVVGNQIGKRNDGDGTAWRIVIRMDNGQYATVTQGPDPQVRNGDYVTIHDAQVYRR